MKTLEQFIVKAKKNGWAGAENEGRKLPPSKQNSHDISFDSEDYHYHDSFVGLSNFCGQEHVTHKGSAIWSMVYYGYQLQPDKFDAKQIISVLRKSLGALYLENRFLGGFIFQFSEKIKYEDTNT